MALTPSSMLPLGTPLPNFELINTIDGQMVRSNDLVSNKATVVMIICNHCPYVKHILNAIVAVANEYGAKGIQFVAISSNDADTFPADGPDKMRELALNQGFSFPYLFDESQAVAKAFEAACTPEFYIFDNAAACCYRGQFDDSKPDNGIPPTGSAIRAALDAVLAGEPIDVEQKPSIGCNIKWKDANVISKIGNKIKGMLKS